MRYRNYFNWASRKRKIYSDEDLLKMTLQELMERENELAYQHNTIGMPSADDLLQSSYGEQYLKEHYNQDNNAVERLNAFNESRKNRPIENNLPDYSELENINVQNNEILNLSNYLAGYNDILANNNLPAESYIPESNHPSTFSMFPFFKEESLIPRRKDDKYQPDDEPSGRRLNSENEKSDEGTSDEQIENKNSNLEQNAIDELESEYWQPSDITLDGKIEKVHYPVADGISQILKKYEGLDNITAIQKAGGKVLPAVYMDYYGLSSRFNDGDGIPDRILKENDIYNLSDIEDKKQYDEYADYVAKNRGLNINSSKTLEQINNTKIVTPNEQSRLYDSIKNTEAFKQWLSDNYEKIKNGDNSYTQSIEFPFEGVFKSKNVRNTLGTIHRADMKNARINNDGSLDVDLRDWYNFEKWKYKDINSQGNVLKDTIYNGVTFANNRAYEQQNAGQLEPYLMNIPIHLSKEELDKLEEELRRKRLKWR